MITSQSDIQRGRNHEGDSMLDGSATGPQHENVSAGYYYFWLEKHGVPGDNVSWNSFASVNLSSLADQEDDFTKFLLQTS